MRGRRAALSAVFIIALFAGPLAASQEGADMRMVDAGFVMRTADTPQKLARLRLLPPLKFIARSRPGGRYFLYADPDVCKCLFVGNQAALQAYRDMASQPRSVPNVPASGIAPQAMLVEDINNDTDNLFGDDDFFDYPF